ncbi:unnamed protein product [Angiostrongylus costaricensis]|uniref:FBD domain-containing protein n=1 Tax=Angiostrongylus costaricensis TaxID=334426 RepID=A0A0R3PVL2_ANGCS|nr:unnamed protein product [Angiostrongylus costaricensis]
MGLLELRIAMEGLYRHEKLRQMLNLLVPFKLVDPNVTFFKRSPGSNLIAEISNIEECVVFSEELPRVHSKHFDFVFVTA